MADKKLKIVRIIARLNIGGPAIHTVLLSSGLNKAGYKDILVCGSVGKSEGDMSYLAREKGIDLVVIPEMGREINLLNDIPALFKLYSLIKKEKPDIVHTHTAKAGTLGRIAAAMAGVPVRVHTFHGHIFDGYFSPVKAKLFLAIERFLAGFTDKLITVSESVKHDVVHRLKVAGPDKVVVIPLGLELDKFLNSGSLKGSFRKRLGVDSRTLLVGIVGRLVPIKNHRMFLDAADAVLKKRPLINIKFTIIGDGELRQDLEEYASVKGLKGHVVFTGWVEDLAPVYSDLDIVTLTSFNEGTPVSLIEAMASGRSVISTDVGGVVDFVRDGYNGLIVKNGDAEALAAKILELAGDGSRRKALGLQGRESVAGAFSKDRLVRDIEDLYAECRKKKYS